MTTTLCIIPARGGSKRLPGKNLTLVGGKPLLAYTVDAARDAAVFDEIVVSSDDERVLALAKDLGVTADRRPDALADDHARAVEVVAEFLSRPGMAEEFLHVAMMLPTCPFRTAADVEAAARLYREHPDRDFLLGVTEYGFPPRLALELTGEDHLMVMAQPQAYERTTRSQSITTAYHPNGSIYLARTEAFLAHGTFFVNPCLTYLMPPERSLDIDYPYQLAIAEALMTTLQESGT